MKYISRHLENKILELSKSYSAILLIEPRQAGENYNAALSRRKGERQP